MNNHILEEADRIISGERQDQYGEAEDNFKAIGGTWTILLRNLLIPGAEIDARLTALMLVSMKTVRESNSPKHDNWVDMAGYAGLGGKIADAINRMTKGKIGASIWARIIKSLSRLLC